jgi:Ca2+-binding EF-hand superfamily protein
VSFGVLSGQVSFDEFLVGIRGVMNSRRKAIVKVAFDVLDKDESGKHCKMR